MNESARADPLLGGLLLIALGAIVLVAVLKGSRSGSLPAGASFFRRLTVVQDENPTAFHLLLLLYGAAGLALEVWGILAVIGLAEPPRIV